MRSIPVWSSSLVDPAGPALVRLSILTNALDSCGWLAPPGLPEACEHRVVKSMLELDAYMAEGERDCRAARDFPLALSAHAFSGPCNHSGRRISALF